MAGVGVGRGKGRGVGRKHLYDNHKLLLALANHSNKMLRTSCRTVKYLYYYIELVLQLGRTRAPNLELYK